MDYFWEIVVSGLTGADNSLRYCCGQSWSRPAMLPKTTFYLERVNMKFSNAVALMSFDGSFHPLFNPLRSDSFGCPITSLTQSFINAGGIDPAVADSVRIAPIDGPLPFTHDEVAESQQSLYDAMMSKEHRETKFVFTLPVENGQAINAEGDELAKVETVTITMEDIGNVYHTLYASKSGWRKLNNVVVSGQRRFVAQLAYIAVCVKLGGTVDDAVTSLDTDTIASEATTKEQLEFEVIRDNSQTGKQRHTEIELAKIYARYRAADIGRTVLDICIEMGDERLYGTTKGSKGVAKVKKGVQEKFEYLYQVSARCPDADIYQRLTSESKLAENWENGKSPIYYPGIHRQDLCLLLGKSKKQAISEVATAVLEANGFEFVDDKLDADSPVVVGTNAKFHRDDRCHSPELFETLFEFGSTGKMHGNKVSVGKGRQSVGDAEYKQLRDKIANSACEDVLLPVGTLFKMLSTGRVSDVLKLINAAEYGTVDKVGIDAELAGKWRQSQTETEAVA